MVSVGGVTPEPTEEELAAIMAAVEATRPVVVLVDEGPTGPPPWRFSGRWWRRPVAARRDRPF
jgi:hypothetical protein